MTPKEFDAMASMFAKSFKCANPQLVEKVKPWKSSVSLHRREMNKTESEFALRLEAMKRAGEILRYDFEGITLRWADMRYTPDFITFEFIPAMRTWQKGGYITKIIEVKGAHIWDRDIVRFKGARAYWPQFQFEMWQKKNGAWSRKL